ncbi:MAG: hypothetical protein ACI4PW_02080 [Alphaproteobacteria bacterium]|jgi:hypothetical protein
MLGKSMLFLSLSALLALPSPVRAQTTMDASMQIQVLLDQFSRIRADLEMALSQGNIADMAKNLGDTDALDSLRKGVGSAFGKKQEDRGISKMQPVLTPEVAAVVDDPEKTAVLMREMLIIPEDESVDKTIAANKKRSEFEFVARATGYGKAVVMRKELDKIWNEAETLAAKAEKANSEMELTDLSNELALLKADQNDRMQMLNATARQMTTIDATRAMARDKESQKKL